MSKITSKPLLQKNVILAASLVFYCFLVLSNAFSQKHWNKKFVSVFYVNNENCFIITFQFIDYEFGPKGERAYLDWAYFVYSTDGRTYNNIFKCEVNDQVFSNSSRAFMSYKLEGSDILFIGTNIPRNHSMWVEDTNVEVQNNLKKASLTIKWFLPSRMRVYDILVKGQWLVSGLYCPEDIDYVNVYQSPKLSMTALNSEEINISKQIDVDTPANTDKLEYNAVSFYKLPDTIVIKGVNLGDNIQVFTTTGSLIKSRPADDNIVKIELPANQIYFVNIGLARYKIAL